MPAKEVVSIDKDIDVWMNFGTTFLLERREVGFFNLGGAGIITVDETDYELGLKDCLYIASGSKSVTNFLYECKYMIRRKQLVSLVQKV
jgi:4-deoxy-L-threo-5-hexosulose-uronate ketol-isomerase